MLFSRQKYLDKLILPRRNEDGILILGLRQFLLDEQCILL